MVAAENQVLVRVQASYRLFVLALLMLTGVALGAPLSVETSSREKSRNFFNAIYHISEGFPMSWTGNTANGTPGTTSSAFKDAVVLRVNFFRAMAGVPAEITFSGLWNAKAQKAALMMSANNQLSHTPPASWKFYSSDGAEAAGKSDLFLGLCGPEAISEYVEDFGNNNGEAGHRRWILYPQTKVMGTGDVPVFGTYLAANTLWVLDGNFGGMRPLTRDSFVAWPPPGYVPYQFVYPRWSFAYPNADFSKATVTMKRDGVSIAVRKEANGVGYGENTLVWIAENRDASSSQLTPIPAKDAIYSVAIDHVQLSGLSRSFSYTVTMFDPQTTGADTVLPVVNGSAQVQIGQATTYAFNTVPGADGYEWRSSRQINSTFNDGAESGASNFILANATASTVISTDFHANGAASLHLTQNDFSRAEQSLTINRSFLAGASSQLVFASRLGYATSTQVARVQVSLDDGGNWKDVYNQPGNDTGYPIESSFSTRTISLSALAGRVIKVRLLYDYFGDTAYTGSSPGLGWYVDDIRFSYIQELQGSFISTVATASQFSFTPDTATNYLLQVRAKLFGAYPLEWGPAKSVTAISGVTKPSITIQPKTQTALIGADVTFGVTAAGSAPLSYQWKKDNVEIPSGTEANLTLHKVGVNDAGSYSVTVRNAAGTATSNAATLNVLNAVQGSFSGLISSETKPGFISVTVTGNATFTAAIKFGGKSYSLRGSFDKTGTFTKAIVSNGVSGPLVNLKLEGSGTADRITGSLMEDDLVATITTNRTSFTAVHASPAAGRYTFVLQHPALDPLLPGGNGYGAITVDATGNGRISGKAGDGNLISFGAKVSDESMWPIYFDLYLSKGWMTGWCLFGSNPNEADATLDWMKPASVTASFYPQGFSTTVSLLGSRYKAPALGTRVVSFPDKADNGMLTFGDAAPTQPKTLTLTANNKVTLSEREKFAMTILLTNGTFNGTFVDDANKSHTFGGALLQKPNRGAGLFRANGKTGFVEVDPIP